MASDRSPTPDASSDISVAPGIALSLAAKPRSLPVSAPGLRVAKWADGAGLVLLMLAAGTLLLRPADLIPALAGAPIYQCLMVACLVVSLPRVLEQLAARSLRSRGIVALVLGLVPAVILSHLSHGDTFDARLGGGEMAKAAVFYLLVVALVASPVKLKAALAVVTASVFGVTVLAVLEYHGVLDLPALRGVEQTSVDPSESGPLMRLCGVGVFNDPNDFSLILVIACIVCAYGLGERRLGRWRWALAAPIGLFGYALILTHSRGGLIAAVGALLAFLPARFGWRNALPLAFVLLPAVLAVSWGRQTTLNLDDPEDTFQTRLELWNHALDAFRSAPLLGIGQGKLVDQIGQVAHNSFLHAFAETGLLGGTAFIGSFYLVLRGLWRAAPANAGLARMRPYVLALTVGYAAGLVSLSRCYTVPTQLVLALGTVFLVLASRDGPVVMPALEWPCIRRVTIVGLAFLAAVYVFVRVMLNPALS